MDERDRALDLIQHNRDLLAQAAEVRALTVECIVVATRLRAALGSAGLRTERTRHNTETMKVSARCLQDLRAAAAELHAHLGEVLAGRPRRG